MTADWLGDAPLFAAWRRFVDGDPTPFTIPGHKRRGASLDPALARLLDADVPLYGGADTVKLTAGVLAEAERRAAALWGADVARFSTGGSTHANQVLCLAVGRPGDTVLVARNAHRSVLGGLVLADLRPVWLPVETDPTTGAPLGIAPTTLEFALAAHPEAAAVLLTEPSYQGTISDLPALIGAAHGAGAAVLVDAAWGAHLGFADGHPRHALALGADAMVTSAHKALPAFSQASLVLARGERMDLARLDRAFEATHTTSPSAAILASIDAARALLGSEAGRGALERTAALVASARDRLRSVGLHVPGPADHPPGRFDPLKLVVHFADGSGLAVEDALLAAGMPVEMADRATLVAHVGLTDDAGTLDRLVGTVVAAVPPDPADGAEREAAPTVRATPSVPRMLRTPREAFFAPACAVPRAEAIGRACAEVVAPYPPGVPLLVPGEEITADALAALDTAVAASTRIAYAADPSLATLQVIADD